MLDVVCEIFKEENINVFPQKNNCFKRKDILNLINSDLDENKKDYTAEEVLDLIQFFENDISLRLRKRLEEIGERRLEKIFGSLSNLDEIINNGYKDGLDLEEIFWNLNDIIIEKS